MNTKTFLTVASATLLTVPAAWAAHPESSRGYRVTRYQLEEVQKMAHEVEDRSRRIHRSAERFAHHASYREERALVRLHELEDRARHFHRQIERYRQNFRHTESDFRELQRAYDRAAYAMHDLHAFNGINREFRRLSNAMYDLEMYAGDLFDRARPAQRRYRHRRDWDSRSRDRVHGRIILPRGRIGWHWFLD